MAFFTKKTLAQNAKEKQILDKEKKQRTKDELALDAKMNLNRAERKYMNVIDLESRNIRYIKSQNGNPAQIKRSVAKIKNAYYALSLIDNTRMRISDIQTSEELFSALNDMGRSMKIINNLYKKSEKPNVKMVEKQSEKIERTIEKQDRMMESMFPNVDNIDDFVSDEIVDKIVSGEMNISNRYPGSGEGIKIFPEDISQLNFDDLMEDLTDVDMEQKDNDFMDDIDFSDIKF